MESPLDGDDSDDEVKPSKDTTTASPAVEVYEAIHSHELMLNQATSKFEHAVVAPLLLLNGGGAVAYLTLLGALNRNSGSAMVAVEVHTVAIDVRWIVPR